jgi:uncharacterized protein YbcI
MDTNLSRDRTSGGRGGGEAAELSNAMVRLYKELFGRGPTKSHSAYATPDLVICTLEESLTAAERKLLEMGGHQALRDTRMFFQHASDDEFVQAVEAISGRVVRAFVSGIDTTAGRIVGGLLPPDRSLPRRRRPRELGAVALVRQREVRNARLV